MTTWMLESAKQAIHYRSAVVTFDGFEEYKEQAQSIADYINSVELTEDNVKEVKADLAAARKVTDGLNRKRIDIKNEVMKSTKQFEDQVKELQNIIGEAETNLRRKLWEMEQAEREAKKVQVNELFNKRVQQYSIAQLVPDAFDRFLTPQHLNKTTTFNAIEREMISWLEDKEQGITLMKQMGDQYLTEYLLTLDTNKAIANVQERTAVTEIIQSAAEEETDAPRAMFIVTGKANIELTERLLNENGIDYKRR